MSLSKPLSKQVSLLLTDVHMEIERPSQIGLDILYGFGLYGLMKDLKGGKEFGKDEYLNILSRMFNYVRFGHVRTCDELMELVNQVLGVLIDFSTKYTPKDDISEFLESLDEISSKESPETIYASESSELMYSSFKLLKNLYALKIREPLWLPVCSKIQSLWRGRALRKRFPALKLKMIFEKAWRPYEEQKKLSSKTEKPDMVNGLKNLFIPLFIMLNVFSFYYHF